MRAKTYCNANPVDHADFSVVMKENFREGKKSFRKHPLLHHVGESENRAEDRLILSEADFLAKIMDRTCDKS